MDFAGPIFIRNEAGEKVKSYITLFTCAITRAVHLELVPDLSTFEFLLALRRFLNRFPAVSRIISDNGLTFKRAAKEIKIIFSHIKSREVQSTLANSEITWEFITERSPWMGGFWERLVQTVKRPLRKILGTNILSFRELSTVLTDIEVMVNNRPLTTETPCLDQVRALCPADLLYGYRSKQPLPEILKTPKENFDTTAIVFSSRWKHQQSMLSSFWKRFVKEYLQYLRSAHMRKPIESRPLKVGDVGLLQDPSPSRAFWPLCRAISLSAGGRTDLRSRSCLIRLPTGQVLKRPIQAIYPLQV